MPQSVNRDVPDCLAAAEQPDRPSAFALVEDLWMASLSSATVRVARCLASPAWIVGCKL